MFIDFKPDLMPEFPITGKNYTIKYSTELREYFLCVKTNDVKIQERFYTITEDDYLLFQQNTQMFEQKFSIELAQDEHFCLNNKFVGSVGLRDYDGIQDFHRYIGNDNYLISFCHYNYLDGILYARIVTDDNNRILLVPPIRAVSTDDGGYHYPFRKMHNIVNYKGICYGIWEDEVVNIGAK